MDLKKYIPIFALNFVNIIGFTLLIPVLPEIIAAYIVPQWQGTLYGVMISSYAFFQFIGAPVLGALSDRYGRRPVLFLSQFGTMMSWVIFGGALLLPNISVWGAPLPILVMMLSRVTDGLTGGNISVANAWIADITPQEDRTKAFGMLGAVFGIGFLFGPAIGGLASASALGFLGTALVAFVISLITLGVIHWFLPESLPPSRRDSEVEIHLGRSLNVYHQFAQFRSNPVILSLLMIRIFFALVFASYTTIIILYMAQAFELSSFGLGLALSSIGIFSIVNQALIAPRAAKVWGEMNTVYASMALLFGSLITLPLIPDVWVVGNVNFSFVIFMFVTYFINLGMAFGMPSFKSLLTRHVDPRRQGMITGLDESLLALGNAISPVLSGSIYTIIGTATFWIFALLLLAPHFWIKWFTGRWRVRA